MFEFIVFIYFLYVALRLTISVLEFQYIKKTRQLKAVILDDDNYQKSASYKLSNEKLSMITTIYDFILFLFWIVFGLKILESRIISDESSVIQGTLLVLVFIAINYILSLPFEIYSTFIKDKKFGFSNLTPKLFIVDNIKSALIFIIVGGGVIALISWIIVVFNYWWVWSFFTIVLFILFINMIYPTFIAPLFNKFIPLEDSELKDSIEKLMKKSGLSSSGIFTMDASKRDNRLNAYFGGLGKSKRVVLFDTLIKKLNQSELLAVLGHELGHFKHKDIIKNILTMTLMLFVLFLLFGNLPSSVYEALNIQSGAHGVIVVFLLLSPIISFIMMPIFGWLSRKNEYAADKYGSECESKEALSSALIKLASENKSYPYSHKISIIFYHTHPPLIERLKALGVKFEF